MTTEGPLVHLKEHREIIDDDLRLIRSHVPGRLKLLDIGAGRGWFVEESRHQGIDAYALDMQTEAAGVWQQTGIPGVIGEGSRTPFQPDSFDVVRMKEVIEHVEDPLSLVREARRLLRPGGILVAHVPTPYSQFYPVANFWDDYTHVRPISRYGLQRLMEDAGLRMEITSGYMSGRNTAERMLGKVLSRVLPHMYRVIARNA